MTVLDRTPQAGADSAPVYGRRARFDAFVRRAAGWTLWLSLLLVTSWWISDRGVQDLFGWASGLTSVGRITGLVASVLLLAQVVLMARVPVLERAFGQDRLAHLHRLVGFTSFNLMVLHVLTITWGYAGGGIPAIPSTFWDLTTNYAGMLLALAGTACLVMVVVTSVKAARRRLRYESWHLMHLYAYLGVGLALPHQLWTGQQFTDSPTKTVFWWTAWAASAAAVLCWRLAVPAYRNLRHRLRVTSVVDEGEGTWSVYVTGEKLDRLKVEPGQFFGWRFLNGPGWSRANPYSLSAAPDGRSLRITVQGVGDGSDATRALKPGTRVLVEGPYGRLSERARTRHKVAFIGAGVGSTPLRALAEGLEYRAGDAVYLERFTDRPLFAGELDQLAAERGLRVLRLPGRRRTPDSWLGAGIGSADDLTALRYWVPDIADRDVYVCGPTAWAYLVLRTLDAAGVPEENIHLETFAW
ncbi:ferredoxin reductase family protein [Nocardioides marmorisolisilvae]|uniref:Oxidoreductase n=1 Tax=Nocardioides marmorisolisilvae TaxID=1542737 RepID=A0A3N0DT37_9ACTN|nr:ferredoxin reductase family protein [Nocardioides marmorisolisilvae]RNL78750.1 oxidoreductase [Nocardioides marmorisolisilvae]